MKKDTIVVIMTITILLLALPAEAADFTLGIFGNANGDETINMQDVTYTELIILEYKEATELADAKYDSEIDILDVTQIELTILGREKELTLIDSADRVVTVEKPVEKVVFYHQATAEAISLLGAWNRVISSDYWTKDEILFPGIGELPVVGGPMGAYDINFEKVFELDPDIFLTTAGPEPGLEDVIDNLEPEIPVVALNFYEPSTMLENLRKLSYILNTKEEGEEFIAFYEGVISEIEVKVAGLTDEEKPRVFLKGSGWTAEQLCTFTDEMPAMQYQIGLPGGINIAADLPGEFVEEVDTEWLIDQNPDIVVAMMWEYYYPDAFGYDVDDTSSIEAARAEVMDMDVFAGGKAVEEGRVYLYDDQLGSTPRFIVGVASLAKWFHPELFEDLDPQAIHQQYLKDFMGVDYDLDENGVFVYPEP